MTTSVLAQTGEILARDGMMPAAVAISLLASCDDYWEVFSNPLSAAFSALVGGAIVGEIFSRVSPSEAKPWIVGSLLLVAGGTVLARMTGKWHRKKSLEFIHM